MTGSTRGGSPSNRDRRAAARQKAAVQREQARRSARRRRLVLQLAIGGAVLAVLAVVSLVIVTAAPPPSSGPRNMADGAVVLSGADRAVVRTAADPAGATPAPPARSRGTAVIQVWEDFGCPACRAFEAQDAPLIRRLVAGGAARVEYRPVAFLDSHFAAGDRYSTRAANAAAAVADLSPAAWPAFHDRLFRADVQPAEGGPGLSDARLLQIAQQAGATHLPQIRAAIRSGRYEDWTAARTDDFTHDRGALSGVRFPASHQSASTPTVLVDGEYWDGEVSGFGAFFTATAGS